MLDTVTIAQGGAQGGTAAAAYAGRLSVGNVAASFSTEAAKQPVVSEAISPRIKADPVAGVIVQFLDSRGEVQTQTPSAASIAYMKAGLTAAGEPRGKEEAAQQVVA